MVIYIIALSLAIISQRIECREEFCLVYLAHIRSLAQYCTLLNRDQFYTVNDIQSAHIAALLSLSNLRDVDDNV